MLIVDYSRAIPGRRRCERSGPAAGFADAPGVFTARENPPVLTSLHFAWNRVVRRQFMIDMKLATAPGWYEDVSFTYPLLRGGARGSAR